MRNNNFLLRFRGGNACGSSFDYFAGSAEFASEKRGSAKQGQ